VSIILTYASCEKTRQDATPIQIITNKESYSVNESIKLEIINSSDSVLSRPLQLSCARDCYATTLDRGNVPREKISRMLGHSNVVITEHYLDGLDPDDTFGINRLVL
jgi:hypothetical protein